MRTLDVPPDVFAQIEYDRFPHPCPQVRRRMGLLRLAATGEVLAGPMRHDGSVMHAAFSPDGKRVVATTWDDGAAVWDAAGKVLAGPLKHQDLVRQASLSPDGERVVTQTDATSALWDATTGERLGCVAAKRLRPCSPGPAPYSYGSHPKRATGSIARGRPA